MNEKEIALALGFRMYVDEPCGFCGVKFTEDDLYHLIWIGYQFKEGSRCAHGECWKNASAEDRASIKLLVATENNKE